MAKNLPKANRRALSLKHYIIPLKELTRQKDAGEISLKQYLDGKSVLMNKQNWKSIIR